jgi:diguanylate cyclase (GGDEF)-like protein
MRQAATPAVGAQRARFFRWIQWTVLATVTPGLLALAAARPENALRFLAVPVVFWMLAGGLFALVGRGRIGFASSVLLAEMWLVITALSWTAGGVFAAAAMFYIVLVLTAGLLLGTRGGAVVALIVTATLFGLALAGRADVLPASSVQHSELSYWIVQAVLVVLTLGLQVLAVRTIGTSLARARNELAARRRTEDLLRRHQEQLEAQVAQRTAHLEREIARRVQAEEDLYRQANYDKLTGLPNRRLFFSHANQAVVSARRHRRRFSLLFIDLDGFKAVNDTHGHDTGDALLAEVATRLRACVRETDTVARMGGDEFTVLLTDLTADPDASMVARRMLDILAAPFDLDGTRCRIGASIGIASYPDHAEDLDALMAAADGAMYAVKRSGKNEMRVAAA